MGRSGVAVDRVDGCEQPRENLDSLVQAKARGGVRQIMVTKREECGLGCIE